MNTLPKFRAWNPSDKVMVYEGFYIDQSTGKCHYIEKVGGTVAEVTQEAYVYLHDCGEEEPILMQWSGLKDKKGNDIYEGDIIRIRQPYRSTQTHTGDNIPNGSYTEPMEPAIKTIEEEVVFIDGMFCIPIENGFYEYNSPLTQENVQWTEDNIKSAIALAKEGANIWDAPEEGDLQYLLQEFKLKDIDELIDFVSGIEIIGNIHEQTNLL